MRLARRRKLLEMERVAEVDVPLATTAALLAFIFLVVPGVAFELLRQTRRPAFDQTATEELARVLVASIGFGSLAAMFLAGVSLLFSDVVIDVKVFAAEGPGWYWRNHPAVVLSSIFLQTSLATLLGAVVHRSLNHPDSKGWASRATRRVAALLRHTSGEQIERFGVWRTIFRDFRPHGAETQVTLVKRDGTLITGTLGGYDTSGPIADRNLALSGAVHVLRPGWDCPRELPGDWKFIIIPGSEISEVMVTWPPSHSTSS